MRLTIVAIGRMKAGPEQTLAERYLGRLSKSGPALGLDYAGLVEHLESRAPTVAERRREEGSRLVQSLPDKAALIALDETGRTLSSEDLAASLAAFRDEGLRDLGLIVGGPDGLDADVLPRARLVLSLGRMTWPHQIARILLAEQLYRATTILSGHPYHRA